VNILEKKLEIISDIGKVNDEGLLEEIRELLHRDEAEIPEWHKKILLERLKEDEAGNTEWLDWEDVKKQL
jgi:hypothetical protein